MREILSKVPIWGAIISAPPLSTWKRKNRLKKIIIICHHEFRCKFLVLISLQFCILMCEFCQMTWTFQNLISLKKYLILDLQKVQPQVSQPKKIGALLKGSKERGFPFPLGGVPFIRGVSLRAVKGWLAPKQLPLKSVST